LARKERRDRAALFLRCSAPKSSAHLPSRRDNEERDVLATSATAGASKKPGVSANCSDFHELNLLQAWGIAVSMGCALVANNDPRMKTR
jgi:hypothetical protein